MKMEEVVNMGVLATGDINQYAIPSFPVFEATLREVKLQWDDEEKIIHVPDTSAHDYNLLDHHLPAIAVICFNCKNAFIIKVQNHFCNLI